eukprot:1157633-Pelagomonas_calceolata.AAC.2
MHTRKPFHPFTLACTQWPKQLNTSLAEVDPELFDLIEKEKNRQWKLNGRGSHQGTSIADVIKVWYGMVSAEEVSSTCAVSLRLLPPQGS